MGRFAKPQVTIDLDEYIELKDYKRIVSTTVIRSVLVDIGKYLNQSGNISVLRQFREILMDHDMIMVGGKDVSNRDDIEIVGKNQVKLPKE